MSNAFAKIEEDRDSKIAIIWFIDNGMELHHEKFQFMATSNNDIKTHT